jgi:hypothetical protein
MVSEKTSAASGRPSSFRIRVPSRHTRGRTLTLIVAILFVSLGACSRKGDSAAQSQISYGTNRNLQATAWEAELPTDVVLAIDQSGSMSARFGATDPKGLRVDGSRSFIEFIASRSNPSSVNRFGLVNFGTGAPSDAAVPLTRISSADDPTVSQLRAKLKALKMGDTNFTAALKEAMALFRASGSLRENRNRAIVIFTDGEPDDPRKLSLKRYFDEIRDYYEKDIRPSHIALFVIGIDTVGKTWTPTAEQWRSIAGDDHVFTTPDMASLKAHFNRIIQRVWNLPEVESVQVASGKNTDFTVEPYLEAVEFHVFPGREGLSLKINRADGSVIHPGKDPDTPPVKKLGTFDRIIVNDPKPGLWSYQVVGGSGSVEVLRNPIPLRLQLISPSRIHPQGKPMRLLAEFLRVDGTPVASDRDYPLALAAEVRDPVGRSTPVKFSLDQGRNGVYLGDPDVTETGTPGEFHIVLKVSGGEKYHSKQDVKVEVRTFPYLQVEEPRYQSVYSPADRVLVQAKLMQSGKPITASVFSNHADQLVIAQVIRTPNGSRGPAQWLRSSSLGEGTRFEGVLPVPTPVLEGRYDIVLKLAPEEEQKADIADQTVLSIMMRQPLWRKYLPWSVVAAIILLALLMWQRRQHAKALRFSFHYWTAEMAAPDMVLLRTKAETADLGRVPIRISRIGKSKRVRIEGGDGATLLTMDGRERQPFEAIEDGTVVVKPKSGCAFAMNYGLDCQVSKPIAFDGEPLSDVDALTSESSPTEAASPTPRAGESRDSADDEKFKWDV